MVKPLAAVAAEPADLRMRLQGVLERAAAAADAERRASQAYIDESHRFIR